MNCSPNLSGSNSLKVSIASGKGGTGKTLLATSLAVSLADRGAVIADCDVEEPNVHLFFPNKQLLGKRSAKCRCLSLMRRYALTVACAQITAHFMPWLCFPRRF